jgi:hypothetical protein
LLLFQVGNRSCTPVHDRLQDRFVLHETRRNRAWVSYPSVACQDFRFNRGQPIGAQIRPYSGDRLIRPVSGIDRYSNMRAITVIPSRVLTSASLALALLITGCASGLSKQECRLADWRTIGYEDGLQGLPQSRIGGHRKACAEYGVALNLDAYRSGWDEGVRRYCQPGSGYRLGRSGVRYNGVCPAGLEPGFLQAYASGHEIYTLESEVKRLQRTLDNRRSRMAEIEVQQRDTGIGLVAERMSTEQRVVLLDELRKLEEERTATRAEIPYLEAELENQRQRLSAASAARHY